jgi:hypothetical protein
MHRFYRKALMVSGMAVLSFAALSDSLPPDASYRPLPTQPFSVCAPWTKPRSLG